MNQPVNITEPKRKLQVRSAAELTTSQSLVESLQSGRYQGYTYSYPHKTAYRWFDDPLPLRQLWEHQSLQSSFLYAHVPFCEMRCGFCNLFTTTDQSSDREERYLIGIERQAKAVRSALPAAPTITSGAVGGGTPTILSAKNLQRLFSMLTSTFDVDLTKVPFSIETSPETVNADKVGVLDANHAYRISIGIQSWSATELRAMGRPQNVQVAHAAVDLLRNSAVHKLNIDLIYGVEGQTVETMKRNIAETLQHQPDEVFLYPLYVRPLTGLGRNTRRVWDDDRLAQYRAGRDALLEAGFRQVSMRRFEKPERGELDASFAAAVDNLYECQRDPMIGLGPGARSYTSSVHYSSDWAVGRDGVGSIIDSFAEASDEYHAAAHYGAVLSRDDQQRRFILQGLLHETGLDFAAYRKQFGSDPMSDFAQLGALVEHGFSATTRQDLTDVMRLSPEGLEFSDAIGPWLYAPEVVEHMSDFVIR
jgi:oxygen-independent coproporphyrinogen III oxidase